MQIKRFQQIVARTIDALPLEFRDALKNIEIVVEEWPTDEQLDFFEEREGMQEGEGDDLLLGLYEGIPLHERSASQYSGYLPDRITLFRACIVDCCGEDEQAIAEEIRLTLLHEIGHYFGMDDEQLRKLGY